MNVKEFTNNSKIFTIIEELKLAKQDGKLIVSDITDAAGNQYVDIVMEGGGVLGIALAGYIYVLEEMGIRFLQVAGTSAGSIVAALLAAGGKFDEPKSQWITEELANLDLKEFIDGDDDARDFVKVILDDKKTAKLIWKGWQVVDNFTEDLGLNPGAKFYDWMLGALRKKGVETVGDLKELKKVFPKDLRYREKPEELFEPNGTLAIIAADITTETRAILPEMAELYWEDPNQVKLADFVRASMSVPFFFHPFRVKNIPQGHEAFIKWQKKVNFRDVPQEVVFVDGGIISNFPIDVFHNNERVPRCPTFGIKLGTERDKAKDISKFSGFLGAIFDASRNYSDAEFLKKHVEYKHLISYIKTDGYNWLDFNLSDEKKIELFIKGAECAYDFLIKFDWKKYKTLRKDLIEVYKDSDKMETES